MQESARYLAVYELLEEIFKQKKPADDIIYAYVKEKKFMGSSDRRFVTNKVWEIIRNKMKLSWQAKTEDLRKILLCYLKNNDLLALCDDSKYGLKSLTEEEKIFLQNLNEEPYPNYVEAECPEWLFEKINDVELLKSLNKQASADFRINNHNRELLLEQLKAEGFECYPTPYSPIGIRSDERINLNNCIAYQEGQMDVQDEASQLACILSDVSPFMKIMDFCCGAGGKTLTMSYLLRNQGCIFAHDVSKNRINAMKPRLARLSVRNVEIVQNVTDGGFDRFVLDAPCSGSGTWRRSPDAKFRLTPQMLEELNRTQLGLLHEAYKLTKIGGRIMYFTCSVLPDENQNIINKFMQENKNVRLVNLKELWNEKIKTNCPFDNDYQFSLNPLKTTTDGFFICALEKTA